MPKLYAMAEHRQAYASWCARNSVKQNHAVFVRSMEQLRDLSLSHDQFIFVDGWDKNPLHPELLAGYGSAIMNKQLESI